MGIKFDLDVVYDYGLSLTEWRSGREILETLIEKDYNERSENGELKGFGQIFVYLRCLRLEGLAYMRKRDADEDNYSPLEYKKRPTGSKDKEYSLRSLVFEII